MNHKDHRDLYLGKAPSPPCIDSRFCVLCDLCGKNSTSHSVITALGGGQRLIFFFIERVISSCFS